MIALTKWLKPHDYQREAALFCLRRPGAGLFLDPGLGKTSISLLVINGLHRTNLAKKTLVIAPLRVAYSVWPAEVAKWGQFQGLRVSIVHGSPGERVAALEADADIYVINPEGVVWLSKQPNLPTFDLLIVDEVTKFKSPKVKSKKKQPTRWYALREMLPMFAKRIILTGTPTPNTLIDLWTQIYILDGGERLGKNITAYRKRWFYPGRHFGTWHPKPGAKEEIEALIQDIVLVMDCRDYLDMPDIRFNDIVVKLPPKVKQAYDKLEKDLFFELETSSESIEEMAKNSASKYNLARQVANGGLYVDRDTDRRHVTAHDAKIAQIESLYEELNGKPLIVVYQFKHELDRLKRRFGKNTPAISGGVAPKRTNAIVDKWNAGEIPLLFCQPQAMSHGLNMQDGGCNMVWLGLTNDLEVYLQTIARLWRQGQMSSVMVHRILAEGTIDFAIRDRNDEKDAEQRSFLDSLKSYKLAS